MIEWGEFKRLMRRLAPALPDDEVLATFGRIDADGSGEVDFEEFSVWWASPEGKALRGEDKREAEQEAKLAMLRVAVIKKAEERAAEKVLQQARQADEVGSTRLPPEGVMGSVGCTRTYPIWYPGWFGRGLPGTLHSAE